MRTINIFTYFKKLGIDTVDSSFYSQIKKWENWYNGDVQKIHRYYVYNGKNQIRCRRLSLCMAKKLCEDMADLLLNERVKITVGNSDATNDFVQKVLEKNKFLVKGNDYQERKACTGTVAYIAQIKDAQTDEEGMYPAETYVLITCKQKISSRFLGRMEKLQRWHFFFRKR